MKIVKPIIFNSFDFSRASIATYYDENGLIATAGVNVLRLGYNPATLDAIGPIIEGESTNLMPDSEDFSGWVESSSVVTTQSIVRPDGTTALTTKYSTAAAFNNFAYASTTPAAGVFTAYSVYVKYISGMSTVYLQGVAINLAAPDFYNIDGSFLQSLPNGWKRIGAVVPSNGVNFNFNIGGSSGSGAVYLWGMQVEGADAVDVTSYIATSGGPETRAADTVAEAPPRLVSSNVDEDLDLEWNPATIYSAGAQAIVFQNYNKVYESIGTTPAGQFPPAHPEYWIDQGATNRWRMFDMTVGPEKQTVSTDSSNIINVLLEVDQVVTSVSLFNMEANNVRIIMRDEFGTIVYDHYEDLLQETPSSDWWSFFFATRSSIKTLVLTDLPTVKPSTIEMILDGDAFPAKIGKMIVGEAVEIGCARYGTSVGIVDFSRKERDDFGNNFILERRYIDRADFDVQIPTSSIDSVKALLTSLRATPTLYIGDEQFASTVIYGFYRDFSIIISGPKRSDLTIQVESI